MNHLNKQAGHVEGFAAAVADTTLAIALIDLMDFTILAASRATLAHIGLSADAIIGRPATDFVLLDDRPNAVEALDALRRGVIDVYIARRKLHAPMGADPQTSAWLRRFRFGDRDVALLHLAHPATEGPLDRYFGGGVTMVIGSYNRDCKLTAVSTEIRDLLGIEPRDLLGEKLIDEVARRDVGPILKATSDATDHAIGVPIHLRNRRREWVPLCLILTSLVGDGDRCFLLVPPPEPMGDSARVAELEQQLWRIAALVEATGVLQRIGLMRDMTTVPEVNDLTTRQWEVLARIVHGERVPTIAADLHLSQSTIRNHLGVIFKRFGVHSQPELLEMLRRSGVTPSV